MSRNDGLDEATETLSNDEGQIDQEALFAEEFAKLTGREPPEPDPLKEEPKAQEKEETSTEEEQAASDQTEWWKSLPEEQQAQVLNLLDEQQRLQNNYRSLHNRLAPTQRQLAEAQRRLQELTTSTPNQRTQGDASSKEAQPQEEDELWQRVKDSDPVLVEAIEKLLAKKEKEIEGKIEDRLRPINERTRESDLEREVQTLLQLVPNAVEVLTSPMYEDWLRVQPEKVQAMHTSPDHRDALTLLRLFDADVARMEQQYAPQTQQQQAPSPKAQEVAQRREEKLKNPIPQQASRPASVAQARQEEDPNELFNKLYAKELKQTSTPYMFRS